MDTQNAINQAMQLVEKVKQGDVNALDAYPDLYELSKSIKNLADEIKDDVIAECSKYDKKEDIIKGGYRFSVVTTERPKYKHDEHWQSFQQAMKSREAMMKKAYGMSKKNQTLTDPETGEIIPPCEVTVSTYPKLERVGVQV